MAAGGVAGEGPGGGGKQVWLAGVGAIVDEEGNALTGDFEAQVHTTFRAIEKTLEGVNGIGARISMISPLIISRYAAIGIPSCVLSSY